MTNLASRILVSAVGLPFVLGMLWLGHWYLFLVVLVAGIVGLHEFYVMTKPLRPIAIAGHAGLIGVLLTIGCVWRWTQDTRREIDELPLDPH